MVKRKRASSYGKKMKRNIRRKYKQSQGMLSPASTSSRRSAIYTPSTAGKTFADRWQSPVQAAAGFLGGFTGAGPLPAIASSAALSAGGYIYDKVVGDQRSTAGAIASAASGKPSVVKPRKFKKGKKKSKNPSIAQLQKRGITNSIEWRKVATGTNSEAIALGHTTLPTKTCALNFWRAIFKYLMLKAGITVKDYGSLAVNEEFVAGDIIRVNHYNSPNATGTTGTSVTITADMTLDKICALLSDAFDNNVTGGDDRLDSIEIVPLGSGKVAATNVQLNVLKITSYVRTDLKVQNVTNEVSTDNEADDITRVPLEGRIYGCKGNNFVTKDNRPQLVGFFNPQNEECLFGSWERQDGSSLGATSTIFYDNAAGPANNQQTTFLRPAEPPRQYEISNCKSMSPLFIGPGEIKVSHMVQKFTVSVPFYFNMLYGGRQSSDTAIVFDEKLGKTNVLWMEKSVGRPASAANSIRLWVELQYRQSMLVHGSASTFTLPIQFQLNG